jgi:hypothetical protein
VKQVLHLRVALKPITFSLSALLVVLVARCGSNEAAVTITETVTATETVMATTTSSTNTSGESEPSVEGFKTPTGNIECVVWLETGYSFMRCTIDEVENAPPQPASCPGDWGHDITMEADGPAQWACVSDVLPPDNPPIMLAYGEKWRRGAFECRSTRVGIRCTNAVEHRLFLSRERHRFNP